MAAQATNQWKVGAFVVGGVTAVVASLFWIGANQFDTEVVERVTYLDESVQGLDIGAPIKIRGVTIGKVTDIRLAPDRRLVEVHAEVNVLSLKRLGVVDEDEEVRSDTTDVSPDIRVTVAAQGITGIKFLEADFYPPGTPTIELDFDPPDNYIPSTPSTLKSLEDAIRGIGDELPLVVRDLRQLAVTLEERIAKVDTARLSDSIAQLAEDLSATLDGSAQAGLGAELTALITDMRLVTARLDETIVRFNAEDGWMERGLGEVEAISADVRAVAQRADQAIASADQAIQDADVGATAASLRTAADSTAGLADAYRPTAAEMTTVMAELRRTLRRIEGLAALLERDPGVLLRGRTSGSNR